MTAGDDYPICNGHAGRAHFTRRQQP